MQGKPVELKNGELHVPDNPIIPFIEGDGIGPDVWRATRLVIDSAVELAYKGKRQIQWYQVYAGEAAYNKFGTWLPEETIEAIRKYRIAIKGPLTTPVGGGFRSLNVTLRQVLDLYVCLRPVKWFEGVPSPLRNPQGIHIVVFRENTEDIYAGIEWMAGTEEVRRVIKFLQDEMGVNSIRFPETSSIGVKPISEEGSKRLVRAAIKYAIKHKLPTVTLVHKGNIMKYTEGAFMKWGYEVADKEFGEYTFSWSKYNRIKEESGSEAA